MNTKQTESKHVGNGNIIVEPKNDIGIFTYGIEEIATRSETETHIIWTYKDGKTGPMSIPKRLLEPKEEYEYREEDF